MQTSTDLTQNTFSMDLLFINDSFVGMSPEKVKKLTVLFSKSKFLLTSVPIWGVSISGC